MTKLILTLFAMAGTVHAATRTTTTTTSTMTQPPAATAPTTTTPPQGTTAADTNNKGEPATGQTGMPTTTFSDAEVARVLLNINEGELDAAKSAQAKAKNAEVKSFANMMYTAHTNNMNETRTLMQAQSLTPKDSELSGRVKGEATQANSTLAKSKGKNFDKAYMDEQINMHEMALRTLDDKLIPSAKNPNFKSHLQTTRQAVADHLENAREIRKKL